MNVKPKLIINNQLCNKRMEILHRYVISDYTANKKREHKGITDVINEILLLFDQANANG